MNNAFFRLILVLLLFLPQVVFSEDLRFYGDLLLARGVNSFVVDKGLKPISTALSPFLNRDAIHIVNLEGALGESNKCAKGHDPCFASKAKLFDLLTGFQIVSLENNHSLDLGAKGLQDTVSELKKRTIVPLGGKSFSTVMVTSNGNIGVVAVTDVSNAVDDRSLSVMAESPEVLREIKRLKEISSAVAVYVHWGRELLPIATDRMKELARKYVEAGADIVVGAHPHVVGPVACVNNKPVAYSLGNFLFDQKYEDTKQGAVLDCGIQADGKLHCSMMATKTPVNSFLPTAVTGASYQTENGILEGCLSPVERTWTGIFTQDRREKRLVLKKDGQAEGFWRIELFDIGTKRLEAKTPPMPIRKLQPVDVNGDGVQEIMLVQMIFSSFDKETAKRIYIYSFNKGFHALWRGSALSRPLIDAAFTPKGTGNPLLIALHSADSFLLRNINCKERVVMGYKWNGFGFTGIKELHVKDDLDAFSLADNEVRLLQKGNIVDLVHLQELRIADNASNRP